MIKKINSIWKTIYSSSFDRSVKVKARESISLIDFQRDNDVLGRASRCNPGQISFRIGMQNP